MSVSGFFSLCAGLLVPAVMAAEPRIIEANVVIDLTFTATGSHQDPFNEILLDGIFTQPDGRTLRVPGFWAGANTWKVRYASSEVGGHSYRTECNVTNDPGLHGQTGTIEV